MTIAELDQLPGSEVGPKLSECCGSTKWVREMMTARPFKNEPNLEAAAARIWRSLEPGDWLEAFSKHPKIGEKSKVSEWSAQEQSGMDSAAAPVTERLADLNREYFQKFGWIFIVCATGKSAPEMLHLLTARLANQPADELRIAAAEQAKITILRLRKLLT